MNTLQFIAAMTGALAWPLTLAFIILLFYRPLKSLVSDVNELSWGDKSAKFTKGLDKTISQAERHLPALPAPQPEDSEAEQTGKRDADELSRFQEVVEVAPSLAVVEAWLPIERELQRIAIDNGYGASSGRSVTFILRRLKDDGVIGKAVVKYIEDLISLRNIALHKDQSIPVEEAQRYREAAEVALARLRAI